jgi:2-haloacid dehalogenase
MSSLHSTVKAMVFDTFGSVVDWRGSIVRDLTRWGNENGFQADWTVFAEQCRSMYQPSLEACRSG